MKKLAKYSIGIGDRFGHQGKAQLEALMKARADGVDIIPVWNKSYREHAIIKTQPGDTRRAADDAVKQCGWTDDYFVDADHVGMKTVDLFIKASDFFTIDVADFIDKGADDAAINQFVNQNLKFLGRLELPNIGESFDIAEVFVREIAHKYLFAVAEAGRIYRHILAKKNGRDFIVEISMDETNEPQSPIELLFILAAIAQQGIPIQTIAPRFTGRFNKGIDYVGDLSRFTREFEADLAVIAYAVQEFKLPANLKLSVHSGSDKFSIYGPIRDALKKFDAGLHLKTAGTTWLAEVIGLAEAGNGALVLVKEIYRNAYQRFDELCQPYATVIDIDRQKLPRPDQVDSWGGLEFASALRHDRSNSRYNPHFRQLLHVGYKIAAEMGDRFLTALKQHQEIIARNVTENIYELHLKRLFGDILKPTPMRE